MSDLRRAAEMALEALERTGTAGNSAKESIAIQALRRALAQQGKECIYPECETSIGCDGPCGAAVKQGPVAWRWKERINDEFDSDWILTSYNPPPYAIQQEPLYAQPVDTVNISQERVDETAKYRHEPVACKHSRYSVDAHEQTGHCYDCGAEGRMKFVVDDAPPKREWVGLTEAEILELAGGGITRDERMIAYAIAAKLREKNT